RYGNTRLRGIGAEVSHAARVVLADHGNVAIEQAGGLVVFGHDDGSAEVPLVRCAGAEALFDDAVPAGDAHLAVAVRAEDLQFVLECECGGAIACCGEFDDLLCVFDDGVENFLGEFG
ncbi:MAG: hypothetical protein ACK559_17055, partial [bacterium]